MALRTDARVVLCRVALPPRGELLLAPQFHGHDINEALSDTATYYLEDTAMMIMASHGVTANADVQWGSVAGRVLAVARKPVLLMPVSSVNDQDEGPNLGAGEALSSALEEVPPPTEFPLAL